MVVTSDSYSDKRSKIFFLEKVVTWLLKIPSILLITQLLDYITPPDSLKIAVPNAHTIFFSHLPQKVFGLVVPLD